MQSLYFKKKEVHFKRHYIFAMITDNNRFHGKITNLMPSFGHLSVIVFLRKECWIWQFSKCNLISKFLIFACGNTTQFFVVFCGMLPWLLSPPVWCLEFVFMLLVMWYYCLGIKWVKCAFMAKSLIFVSIWNCALSSMATMYLCVWVFVHICVCNHGCLSVSV